MIPKIVYVGSDDNCFKNLSKEFIDIYKCKDSDLLHLNCTLENVTEVHYEILQFQSDVVFLDFSLKPDAIYKLAKQILANNQNDKITVISLLNSIELNEESEENYLKYLNKDRNLFHRNNDHFFEVYQTQIPICHYKMLDYQNFVFDGLFLNRLEKKARVQYATYNRQDLKTTCNIDSKITHIDKDELIIESMVEFTPSQEILLNSEDFPIFSKKYFLVEEVSEKKLITNHKYRYKLKILFKQDIEKYLMVEQDEDGQVVKNDEVNLDLYIDREEYNQWFGQYKFTAAENKEKLKIFVAQNSLDFLKNITGAIDDFENQILFQKGFGTSFDNIKKSLPELIAIELDEEDFEVQREEFLELDDQIDESELEELDEVEKSMKLKEIEENKAKKQKFLDEYFGNNALKVKQLINYISQIPFYNPIIIITSSVHNSNEWKEKTKYKYILSSQQKINLDFLFDLLKVYSQKGNNHNKLLDDLIDEKRLNDIIKLDENFGHVEILENIKISSISEHEITFVSKNYFERGTRVRLEGPVPMIMTVVEPILFLDRRVDGHHMNAIISGVTDTEVKTLRRYVNDLFFVERDKRRKQELLDFQKNNQKEFEKRFNR